jgi:hypothetical protein
VAHFTGADGVIDRFYLPLDVVPDGTVGTNVRRGESAFEERGEGGSLHYFQGLFGGFEQDLAIVFVGAEVGLNNGMIIQGAGAQVQGTSTFRAE